MTTLDDYFAAQDALRAAFDVGDTQGVVDALGTTAATMQAMIDDPLKPMEHHAEPLAMIWDMNHPMTSELTFNVVLISAGEPEERAADALHYIFQEPGLSHVHLDVQTFTGDEDDIIVGCVRDDGQEIDDRYVTCVLELATWARGHARGMDNGTPDTDTD